MLALACSHRYRNWYRNRLLRRSRTDCDCDCDCDPDTDTDGYSFLPLSSRQPFMCLVAHPVTHEDRAVGASGSSPVLRIGRASAGELPLAPTGCCDRRESGCFRNSPSCAEAHPRTHENHGQRRPGFSPCQLEVIFGAKGTENQLLVILLCLIGGPLRRCFCRTWDYFREVDSTALLRSAEI